MVDVESLQQWSGLMEAKRNHDFDHVSRGSHLQREYLETPELTSSGNSAELPAAAIGRKPVGSVRHSEIARPVSLSPARRSTAFEPLLDLHEASAILGMHWKTLEAKARGHEVPAFKVGKRWRFRLSSLNAWLEHGINSNTTDHADVTRQERCS